MEKTTDFLGKKYQYRILHEEKLVVEYFAGQIVLDDLLESKKTLLSDPEYDLQYNTLSDLRDATFLLSEYEIRRYLDYAKPLLYLLKKRKLAYIVHTPNQVVFVTFIDYYSEGFLPIEVKNFFTPVVAINWLKNQVSTSKVLENELIELRSIS